MTLFILRLKIYVLIASATIATIPTKASFSYYYYKADDFAFGGEAIELPEEVSLGVLVELN